MCIRCNMYQHQMVLQKCHRISLDGALTVQEDITELPMDCETETDLL